MNFQGKLGLKVDEHEVDKKMKMIINTTMSPWLRYAFFTINLRSQKRLFFGSSVVEYPPDIYRDVDF